MTKFSEWVDKNLVCIIMRGLPGAGKSYKVKQLIARFGGDENHIFSADKFFERRARERFVARHNREPNTEELCEGYKSVWNPTLLGAAHRSCFEEFQKAVNLGITPVILDNTNTTTSQFEKYFKYAEDKGYKVRIEEPESKWWKDARMDLGASNTKRSENLQKLKQELLVHGQHGVPEETIERLINSTWQNIPGSLGRYVKYDTVFRKR